MAMLGRRDARSRRSSWSRRSIIVGSASLLLLPGVRASAQPPRRRPKVAFLLPAAPDDVDTPVDRVRAGLAELGYVDGQTVSLEARFAHHRIERLPALAAELVAAQPDVIHTFQTAPTRALAAATSTIPIVAAPIGEQLLSELVGGRHYPEVLNDAARALGLELVGAD